MDNQNTRGGYRDGAGRKSTWKMGKTKHIKVPEAIEDKVMIAARRIDQEEYDRSQGIDVLDPDELIYKITKMVWAIESKQPGFVANDAGWLLDELCKAMHIKK